MDRQGNLYVADTVNTASADHAGRRGLDRRRRRSAGHADGAAESARLTRQSASPLIVMATCMSPTPIMTASADSRTDK